MRKAAESAVAMSGKPPVAATPARKATKHKTKAKTNTASAGTQPPSTAAASATPTTPDQRKRAVPPINEPIRTSAKKQKTGGARRRSASAAAAAAASAEASFDATAPPSRLLPVTQDPRTDVLDAQETSDAQTAVDNGHPSQEQPIHDRPGRAGKAENPTAPTDTTDTTTTAPADPPNQQHPPEGPTEKSRRKKRKPKEHQGQGQQEEPQQQQQQPNSLPLEPHAALLGELRPRRNVLVLSVLSSSKMEKRIAAILSHLGQPSPVDPAEGAVNASTPPRPGVVLLHARAADAGKLISITEIAKRRIREGFFREGVRNTAQKTVLAWYQYNRLYDVETPVAAVRTKPGLKNHENENQDRQDQDQEPGSEDEDDGFEPMPQHFQQALGDAAPNNTVARTYLSVFLSRVPVPELLKHADITCQTSADPIEMEYQRHMSGGGA